MTLPIAQLPDIAWIFVGCVVVALICIVGLLLILRFLQESRERLASEIQIGLDQAKKPAPVEVQQPLVVQAHTSFATQDEHDALARKMDDEFKRERLSRKGLYEKVESQGQAIARLQTETTQQTRQLSSLDSKMDQVLLRLPRQNS